MSRRADGQAGGFRVGCVDCRLSRPVCCFPLVAYVLSAAPIVGVRVSCRLDARASARLRKLLQRFGPPLGWASLILIATSIPIPAPLASAPPVGADKFVHLTMYGVLAWLTARAFGVPTVRGGVTAVAVVAAFASLDEWHQRFIPGRMSEGADLVADVVGGALGVLAFQAAHRRRESVS